MRMWKIGVIGIGRLGKELVEQGCHPIFSRLDSPDLMDAMNNYDCVINCAGYTNVDLCEFYPATAMESNAIGLKRLVNYRGKFVQLSTDYVFDGKNGPYKIADETNPLGVYGVTKLLGEDVIRTFRHNGLNNDLIIRTTNLFDAHSENFAVTICKLLANGTQSHVPTNLIGNPTYIPELAKAILYAIEGEEYGIRHIVGKSRMSRYEWAIAIADKMGLNKELIKPSLYSGLNIRPLNAGLVMEYEYPMMQELNESLNDFKTVLIMKGWSCE